MSKAETKNKKILEIGKINQELILFSKLDFYELLGELVNSGICNNKFGHRDYIENIHMWEKNEKKIYIERKLNWV